MRLIIEADRPEALWLALRIVQAVLRGTPRTLACSSSVRKPAASTASANSLILADWRAFIAALSEWVCPFRPCAWLASERKPPDASRSINHASGHTTQRRRIRY